jgi:hypothetical protein
MYKAFRVTNRANSSIWVAAYSPRQARMFAVAYGHARKPENLSLERNLLFEASTRGLKVLLARNLCGKLVPDLRGLPPYQQRWGIVGVDNMPTVWGDWLSQ